jgi:hypothetical protein
MQKRPKMYAAPMVRHWIVDKFHDLEEFKNFLISAIKTEEKRLSERVDRTFKEMTEEEVERFSDMFADDFHQIEHIFTRLSLNAFVIILYSFIEDCLNDLCDAERQDKKIKRRYTDIKGKGIKRAKSYLEKVVDLNLYIGENGKNKRYWDEIVALNKLRNAIVHNDGWADDNVIEDVNVWANEDKGYLEIERRRDGSYGRVIIKPGYMTWIVKQAQEFFHNIEI